MLFAISEVTLKLFFTPSNLKVKFSTLSPSLEQPLKDVINENTANKNIFSMFMDVGLKTNLEVF